MTAAAEYRAWAEESLKWAGEAKTANERDAYLKIAETWLQSALRSERLSTEPASTTEHEWVLPHFENGAARALRSSEDAFPPNLVGSKDTRQKRSADALRRDVARIIARVLADSLQFGSGSSAMQADHVARPTRAQLRDGCRRRDTQIVEFEWLTQHREFELRCCPVAAVAGNQHDG